MNAIPQEDWVTVTERRADDARSSWLNERGQLVAIAQHLRFAETRPALAAAAERCLLVDRAIPPPVDPATLSPAYLDRLASFHRSLDLVVDWLWDAHAQPDDPPAEVAQLLALDDDFWIDQGNLAGELYIVVDLCQQRVSRPSAFSSLAERLGMWLNDPKRVETRAPVTDSEANLPPTELADFADWVDRQTNVTMSPRLVQRRTNADKKRHWDPVHRSRLKNAEYDLLSLSSPAACLPFRWVRRDLDLLPRMRQPAQWSAFRRHVAREVDAAITIKDALIYAEIPTDGPLPAQPWPATTVDTITRIEQQLADDLEAELERLND